MPDIVVYAYSCGHRQSVIVPSADVLMQERVNKQQSLITSQNEQMLKHKTPCPECRAGKENLPPPKAETEGSAGVFTAGENNEPPKIKANNGDGLAKPSRTMASGEKSTAPGPTSVAKPWEYAGPGTEHVDDDGDVGNWTLVKSKGNGRAKLQAKPK